MVSRRTRNFIFALALGVVAVGSAYLVGYAPMPLNSDSWKTNDVNESSLRLRMAKWIATFETLEGKSTAEVVALLGEPLPAGNYPPADMIYNLGMESDGFLGVVGRLLLIHTHDGRVARAEIHEWRD